MGKKKNKGGKQNLQHIAKPKEKSPEMLALEQEISELNNQLFSIRNKKAELEKEKKEAEKIFRQKEQAKEKQQVEVEKIKKSAFEIREAIRTIDELKLAEKSEIAKESLLALLQSDKADQNINGANDNKTLAVAVRYKLNDVVLYTEDKNLRNKASAIGIKTN